MDNRLVTLGVIIIVVSTGFLVYGAIIDEPEISGSALTMAILGMVLSAIGLTYRDPLTGLLKVYSNILSSPLVRIYEDLGLIDGSYTVACYSRDLVHVVFSRKTLRCEKVKPGVGVMEETPYIAFAGKPLETGGDDLDTFIMKSGLAQYAVVSKEGETVTVDLRGTLFPEDLGGKKPLNLYQVMVPFFVASHYSSDIEVVDEDLGQGYYKAVFKVMNH
ncbi:MAG: hypothetical protein GSR83_03535 [Desulfurococcales archaeon]|nr:hypothetical protein [Desulfurococcales archaeon]